jgi:hypothetical protein
VENYKREIINLQKSSLCNQIGRDNHQNLVQKYTGNKNLFVCGNARGDQGEEEIYPVTVT